MPKATGQPQETAKAAEAFAAYVALGPGRSLEKLAQQRVRQGYGKSTASVVRVLERWSSLYGWQDRIASARTEQSERMLQEAADLDAETFLETSRLLNERVHYSTRHHLDEIVKMRESVRKPTPKGGTNVNVNVSVEVQQMVDRIAEEDGLTDDEKAELAAAVRGHLAGNRA